MGLSSDDGNDIAEIPISCCPNDMRRFIADNIDFEDLRKKAIKYDVIKTFEVRLLPPILNPQKIICIGLNYKSHCDEQNIDYPKEPVFFNKFPSALCGPTDNIKSHGKITTKMDWEIELGVIMGKKTFQVHRDKAMDYVFGFTIAQDITAREWQKRNGNQWSLSKSFDSFCPLGPCIVHKSDLDISNLTIKCKVNNVLKQCGKTNDFIFPIDDIISRLSQAITLVPGDVILTGTCGGVGVFRNPREFLKVGDVIESEIEGIGKLINTIIE